MHRVGRPKKHRSPKFEQPSSSGAGATTSNVDRQSRRPDRPVDEVAGLVKFSALVTRERGTPEIGSPAGQPPSPGSVAGRQRTLSLQATIRARRFAERPGYIPFSALVQPIDWPCWTLPFFRAGRPAGSEGTARQPAVARPPYRYQRVGLGGPSVATSPFRDFLALPGPQGAKTLRGGTRLPGRRGLKTAEKWL